MPAAHWRTSLFGELCRPSSLLTPAALQRNFQFFSHLYLNHVPIHSVPQGPCCLREDSDRSSTPRSGFAHHALLLNGLSKQPAPLCVLDKNGPPAKKGPSSPLPCGHNTLAWAGFQPQLSPQAGASVPGSPPQPFQVARLAASTHSAVREFLLHTALHQSSAHTDTRETV